MLLDKFFARINVTDNGCWQWTGPGMGSGYGAFRAAPQRYAHRYAYETFVGPIPEGLVIDHLCRNRRCANPAHLEAVTQRVNNLRADGIASRNATATHCPQGHAYDEANTYVSKRGLRYCRACDRDRKRAKRGVTA